MSTYEPRLPGITPVATVRLTAYLHADGYVSHYEVEARGPNHELTQFRAQASDGDFDSDAAFIHSSEYLAIWIRTALQELRDYYRPSERPTLD